MALWPSWYNPLRAAPVADMVSLAAMLAGIRAQDVRGPCRNMICVRARHAVCMIAREHGHSFSHIARCLGGRDHSTIINGVEKARIHAERDAVYAQFISELRTATLDRRPVCSLHGRPVFAKIAPVLTKTKPTPPQPEELSDDELLSRRVAAHYAHAA